MIGISIKDNLDKVNKDLNNGAKLVCVTKFRSREEVDSLLELGVKDIGENKVQNLVDRRETYGDSFNYHMIGRLQTNKVKYLAGWVSLIHSLDRVSLLKELEKQGEKNNFVFNCLVQLNISKEESKTGIFPEDLDDFLDLARNLKYVNIKGFMTMAPNTDDEEYIRSIFHECKKIFDIYSKIGYNNFNIEYLSMGMSNDYKIALEEGANIVRIGSKIFQ